MKKLNWRKIIKYFFLAIIGYHIIFGGLRFLIDFKYPMGWYDNTVTAFGTHLRTGIRWEKERTGKWIMADIQPERQSSQRSDFIPTFLDKNVYDYMIEMGLFYQYKKFYVLGHNGFWIINAEPFHIELVRNRNLTEGDMGKIDNLVKGYGEQITVISDESELTNKEHEAYLRLQNKAQPRIEQLKEQGLYP